MPSDEGYGFEPAAPDTSETPLVKTFTVEIPSTDKPIIFAVAPPMAKFPWLSCCTFAEVARAAIGLVVAAREFNGSSPIWVVSFKSPKVEFSVLISVLEAFTSTVVDCAAIGIFSVKRRSWREVNAILSITVSENPECVARRL